VQKSVLKVLWCCDFFLAGSGRGTRAGDVAKMTVIQGTGAMQTFTGKTMLDAKAD